MFSSLFFITLKISLTNASPDVKKKTNKFIGLTGAIVKLPLLNETKIKQNQKDQEHLRV